MSDGIMSKFERDWQDRQLVFAEEFETLVGKTICAVDYCDSKLTFTDGSSVRFFDHYDEGGFDWEITGATNADSSTSTKSD